MPKIGDSTKRTNANVFTLVKCATTLLTGTRNTRVSPLADSDQEYSDQILKERIPTIFPRFEVYKYAEYPEISKTKLSLMTSVSEVSHSNIRMSGRNFSYTPTLVQRISKHLNALVIPCRSTQRRRFTMLIWLLAFYQITIMPYSLVFGERMSQWKIVLQYTIYAMFWVDIVLSFVTSYHSNADGHEVREVSTITLRFLLTWFSLDLFAALPYAIYQEQSRIDNDLELAWAPGAKFPLSTVTWLQLSVIYIKFIREQLRVSKQGIMLDSEFWRFLSMAANVVFFVNIASVSYFALTQAEDSTWWEKQTIGDLDGNEGDVFMRFIVYVHGTIFFVLGKGSPTTTGERILAVILNVFGLFVTAALVGQVTRLTQEYYAKETAWRSKMSNINLGMLQMGLSEDLQVRIRNYYAFAWAINGGSNNADEWLSELSTVYREEAKIQVNEKLISSVPLFKEGNQAFVHAIIMNLKQLLFLPGDYIIRCGDVGDEMYFVVRGTVQAMDKDETVLYTMLSEGSFFGEIALLKTNSQRTATVRAYTYAQLNVLYKTDFQEILTRYPKDAQLLEREAKLRERNSANVERLKKKKREKAMTVARSINKKIADKASDLASLQSDTFPSLNIPAKINASESAAKHSTRVDDVPSLKNKQSTEDNDQSSGLQESQLAEEEGQTTDNTSAEEPSNDEIAEAEDAQVLLPLDAEDAIPFVEDPSAATDRVYGSTSASKKPKRRILRASTLKNLDQSGEVDIFSKRSSSIVHHKMSDIELRSTLIDLQAVLAKRLAKQEET